MTLSPTVRNISFLVGFLSLSVAALLWLKPFAGGDQVGALTSDAAMEKGGAQEIAPQLAHVTNSLDSTSILVKLLPQVAPLELSKHHPVLSDMGVVSVDTFTRVGNISLLKFNAGQPVEQRIRRLEQSGLVEYAEPNYIVYAEKNNQSRSGLSWSLHNTGEEGGLADADIDAPEAWSQLSRQVKRDAASTPIIAVLDSGIDASHPGLIKHLWSNPKEIPSNGKDDDNNGFVDDVFGLNTCVTANAPSDDNGHGTQVAGVIASINPQSPVKLISMKTLCAGGSGHHSNAIMALEYVLQLREQGVNVSIANLSWGGVDKGRALSQALNAIAQKGIVIVTSAGNQGRDNDQIPHYPSGYDIPQIISVAASDNKDQLANTTNYGMKSVDLLAPGVNIETTQLDGLYKKVSGTSLAAAHVTGTVALAQVLYPDFSAINIKAKVLLGVDKASQFSSKVVSKGRLNAGNIIAKSVFASNHEKPKRLLSNASFDPSGATLQNASQGRAVADQNRPEALEVDIMANHIMMSFSEEFRHHSLGERKALLVPYGVTIVKDFPYAGGSVLLEINGAPSAPAGQLPTGETKGSVYRRVNSIVMQLQQSGLVRYAEPDSVMQATAIPNDPRYNELWGLDTIQAEQAIEQLALINPQATDVIVGVIDTGVDYNHPDLAANMWINVGEVAGNGIDDDLNGYVDDVHGWDAANNDGDPMDDHFHGTHVAGTIGAVRDNNEGIAGVTPYVRLMALKFLNSAGSGTSSGAVELLNYVHLMKQDRGIDIRLTNNSWGGGGYTQSLRDAIAASNDYGVLFVAAAGNDGRNVDDQPSYPSSYALDNIISVAATDRNDELAYFSNYGSGVDIAAPGVDILSSYPNGAYNAISGTSMAAPHVSGAISLLFSMDPSLSIVDAKDTLLNSGDIIPSLVGKTTNAARLNVYNATVFAPAIFELDINNGNITIPEGDIATVSVRLRAIPDTSDPVAVTVEKLYGDEDIVISSGASLTFDQLNWDVWQPVTFLAQEDIGISNDSAVFQVASFGSSTRTILVNENDNGGISGNLCDEVSEIPIAECGALLSFYEATTGSDWANNTGWGSTATPCSWFGVSCQNSHVTSLTLVANNLVGTIPDEVVDLTSLQNLNLYVNRLAGPIPSAIANLTNLNFLDLGANQLTGAIPPELGGLNQLRVLYLDYNDLVGAVPVELGNLTNINTLFLNGNDLVGVIPAELGNLVNLNTLLLNNNQFTGVVPTGFDNLTQLSNFSIRNNNFSGEISESIANVSFVGISYNALDINDSTVIALLNTKDFGWQSTQTIAPKDILATSVDGAETLSWTPIDYVGDGGEYIISYSIAIDGPFIEHGRTASKFSSSYVIADGMDHVNRFYVVQSHTPPHGSQQNDIVSDYSSPLQFSAPSIIITVPLSLILDASNANGLNIDYPIINQFLSSVTAVDVLGNAIIVTNNAPAIFPIGVTTVTFEACVASCSSATQTVTVLYDPAAPAPVVTAPANIVAEAIAPLTAIPLGSATAIDAVDGVLGAIPDQAGPFAVGIHRIVWTATNSSGKSSIAEQFVTIQDTTHPLVTPPLNINIEATAVLTPVSIGVATAVDAVDENLIPVPDKTGPFTLGTHTITWSVTDTAGNQGISFQALVVGDTTAPLITAPASVIEVAGRDFGAGVATATDIFPVTISNDAPSTFPLGITTVTWTARDSSGNQSTAEQSITMAPYYANHSSQIACEKGDDGDTVWVIDPDNDSVSVIDVTTDPATSGRIIDARNDYFHFTDSKPSSITRVNNYVVTTYADSGRIRFNQIDFRWIEGGTVPWSTWWFSLRANERPVASVAHDNLLYVALYASGEVLKIDTVTQQIVSRLKVGPKPKAMALTSDGSRLLVTRFISTAEYGEVYDINTAGNMSFRDPLQPSIKINKIWVPDDIDHGSGVANYLRGIVIDANDQFAYVSANKANIHKGEYLSGEALSADNTIRSMIAVLDLSSHQDTNLDGLTREDTTDLQNAADPSGLTALPDGNTGVYALQGSDRVELYNFDTGTTLPVSTGSAPQSLCATADTLYVKNHTDRTLSVIDIAEYMRNGDINFSVQQVAIVEPEDDVLSTVELQGLQLFYSAQADLSPEGYMSCASCHDDGGHDGMTWDFTHMGEGLRNTLSLRGTGGTRFGPLNWSANADEVQDIEKQIEQLHGSEGLIPGVTFTGQSPLAHTSAGASTNLDALSAYISQLGKKSVMHSPNLCAWGDTACWSTYNSGGWQFHAYGCKSCHTKSGKTGAYRDGQIHAMGTISEASGLGSGLPLEGIRTPTLIELWDTAPYLHDGSAETLEAVMNTGVHASYGLDEREMTHLIQYLHNIDRRQYLDDDALFNP